jgi:hypothetical protein
MRILAFSIACSVTSGIFSQGVQPSVDYWDSTRTVKRSEGLFVNGLEWGEWKFWYSNGGLREVAEFKSGSRDGHVVTYYPVATAGDSSRVQNDGWFKRGTQDSLTTSYYRNGRVMEKGGFRSGTKDGSWEYWYEDGRPMLKEQWEDSIPARSGCVGQGRFTDVDEGRWNAPQLLRERCTDGGKPLCAGGEKRPEH